MKSHPAFSLIEVIFVLVILGIVASISSEIIAQVYESYLSQRAYYNVSNKTELAVNQIVNRLTYRIQGTTISKDHEAFKIGATPAYGVNWLPIKDISDAGQIYRTIEWIGYDNDSFSAYEKPCWSGVANYETASINNFNTPGSELNNSVVIISNLSNNKVTLSNTKPAAVIFSYKNNYYAGENEYSPTCMGLVYENNVVNTDCIFPVSRLNNDTFSFTRTRDPVNTTIRPKFVTERYKLAWSAYTIVPELKDTNGTDNKPLYDLYLYSNYQPWNGERYLDQDKNITRTLLMNNVSVFKFSEADGVMRLKLCAQEDIGQRDSNGYPINVTTCKEKAVIR